MHANRDSADMDTKTQELTPQQRYHRSPKGRLQAKRWRDANPEKVRAKYKKWYDANREYVLARATTWAKANPEKVRASSRKSAAKERLTHPARVKARKNASYLRVTMRRFSLTSPPPSVCEICGKRPARTRLHADHDHTTGAFRGWLCSPCNRSIGQLGDLAGVKRTLTYLERTCSKN